MASMPGWYGPEEQVGSQDISQDAAYTSWSRLVVVTFWLRARPGVRRPCRVAARAVWRGAWAA